eukprot:g22516.t1
MNLRQEISRVMVHQDDGMASAYEVAAGVATTIVYGLAFFGKFIFDLVIVRAQMLSVEAIENISADKARYFKSPFDPLDLRDMNLRQEISRVMVHQDDGMASAYEVAAGVATTIVYGLAFFGRLER